MNEIHVTVDHAQYDSLVAWAAAKFPTDYRDHPHGWQLRVHRFVNHALPDPIMDVFTSERCSGSVERAVTVAENRAAQLRAAGFSPVRVKVECEPWNHPVASGENYYESHMRLLGVLPGAARVGVKNLLLSTNLRKRTMTGTVRSRDATFEQHADRVNRVVRGLLANKITVVDEHAEFVALDTCREHDAAWEATR